MTLTFSTLLRWLPLSSFRLLCSTASYRSHSSAARRAALPLGRPLSTLSSLRADDAPPPPSASSESHDALPVLSRRSADDPLSLDELRSMLRSSVPSTATLVSLVQHVRSQPPLLSQMTPSDYALVCHHLSLHNAAHSDYRALTCLTLMDVYDEYCAREFSGDGAEWGAGWRRELMTDALTVCSRTGEGRGCEFVACGMSFYGLPLTAQEMNSVLWGWRFERGNQWRWYDRMRVISKAIAAGEEPADRDSRTLSLYYGLMRAGDAQTASGDHWGLDSATVLIMMHSNSLNKQPQDERFDRLDREVLRRLTASAFHLLTADPTTAHMLNQLISLSSVMDRDIPRRFSRRVHALFRMANELQCQLTERSLRLAMGAAHILEHGHWTHSSGFNRSEVNGSLTTQKQQQEQPWNIESMDAADNSSWFAALQTDPDAAKFAVDVLAAFQQSGASVGPSSALFFDLHTSAATPWQRVLELFDWVQHEGGHIDMKRALTAIEACYRGKHWQRALDILVLPKWAKGFIHVSIAERAANTLKAPQRRHSRERPQGGSTALGTQAGDESSASAQAAASSEPVEWLASQRRWSGPQHDRLVWLTELKDEPWLLLMSNSEPADKKNVAERMAAVPSLPVPAVAAAAATPSLPLAPLSYPTTILHISYTIAAMDEASNAEAVLKADRLHVMALRLLPFLGCLYQYDTNTVHLHHPLTALDTVNSFVHHPHNQPAKLFSLLYLVWRTMRRRFVDNSSAVELHRLSSLHGDRVHDRWGFSPQAKRMRRDPLRFRVDSEAEARTLQRLLTQPPFELRAQENGTLGSVRRYTLYELAGQPAREHEKQPVERRWWEAMHKPPMAQECVVLELPSRVWYSALNNK